MEYTIKHNEQFNSNEVYFSDKPSEAIRESLKALKMRWHKLKKCWYGFADDEQIKNALNGETVEEFKTGVIVSDGYMGANEYTGVNKYKFDYSSECFKKAFKACGISGVTIKKHKYSGGMSFTFTVKLNSDDFISLQEFINNFNVWDYNCYGRVYYYTTDINNYGERVIDEISLDELTNNTDETIKKEILRGAAEYQYKQYLKGYSIYRQDDNKKVLTDKGFSRLSRIHSIILSFHHDDSNGMVDYFDTNFYYDINYKFPEVK